jgi:hypothetical protein
MPRRSVLILLIAMLALATTGIALAATSGQTHNVQTKRSQPQGHDGKSDAKTNQAQRNQARAKSQAIMILGNGPVPPGAVPTTTDPGPGQWLKGPGVSVPATKELVDVHHFWRVPESSADLLAWIEAHAPTHAQPAASGGQDGTSVEWGFDYGFPTIKGVTSSEQLTISVETISATESALREDGQVVWIAPRPASETIPSGTKKIAVYVDSTFGKHSYLASTITSRAEITRLTSVIDNLPITQPGTAFGCPGISAQTPAVDLRFLGASTTPLAQVVEDDCAGLQFTINGHLTTGLQETTDLQALLWHLHAIGTCSADQLDASAASVARSPGTQQLMMLNFTNTSSDLPCGLQGYPQLTLVKNGQPLPTHVRDEQGTSNLVVLLPKVPAVSNVAWPAPSASCFHPTADTIDAQLPGLASHTFAIKAPGNVDPCGGTLTVNTLEL